MAEVANKGAVQSPSCVWKFMMRTFVENKQLAVADHRTRERNDLALANRQVPAAARDLGVERDPVLVRELLEREEPRSAKRVVKRRVVVLPEQVEVVPERAA